MKSARDERRWERFERRRERHLRRHERLHRRFHARGGRGAPLHVRLFWWFGFTILMMGAVASGLTWFVGPWRGGAEDFERAKTFASGRFAAVWNDAPARDELARAVARDLELSVTLRDTGGRTLVSAGPECDGKRTVVTVARPGEPALGELSVCLSRSGPLAHFFLLVALLGGGVTLWVASFAVARRIGRPLRDLSRVAREIGEGHLQSRVRLGWHQPGEVGALAESINEMAARIEKQLSDQRELVAAVSHEIRAPLSRLRVLSEMLRTRRNDPTDDATLAKIEREIVEIDSLVGDLLASSRLDFSMLTFRALDAAEVALEAVDREGLPAEILSVESADPSFEGDATLVARALSNLLENAARHGGVARALCVRDAGPSALSFEVEDTGPGFPADVLPRAFEPFQRGHVERRGSTSLGLGLALVRRIAEAHGGSARAENKPEGGARVSFTVARRQGEPPSPDEPSDEGAMGDPGPPDR